MKILKAEETLLKGQEKPVAVIATHHAHRLCSMLYNTHKDRQTHGPPITVTKALL